MMEVKSKVKGFKLTGDNYVISLKAKSHRNWIFIEIERVNCLFCAGDALRLADELPLGHV
jgi:hypothetical protein